MKRRILLTLLSAVATGSAFCFSGLSILVWISLVPLFCALDRVKKQEAVWYGFFFGIGFHAVSIFWIGNVSVIGLIALLLYLSCYSVLFCLMFRLFIDNALMIVTIPALWVCIEFIKENIWCGFGWVNIGYSQYQALHLIQIADIFGAKAISYLIVMTNVLGWMGLRQKKLPIANAILVITLFACAVLYSTHRLNTLKPEDYVRVAVIQPNVAEAEKNNPVTAAQVVIKMQRLTQETDKNSLVVFPEAAWPVIVRMQDMPLILDFAKSLQRDILIGAVKEETEGFYNSALFIGRQGELFDVYRKIRLVPFGEYVPLRRFLGFIEVLNSLGDMKRGVETTVFRYRDTKFSTLICFEDVSPDFVSRFSKNSDFLVNITNDEWFRGEPQAHQHLANLVFRAIENRRSMVRCANTGISGWVSFTGRVVQLAKNSKSVFVDGVATYDLALIRIKSLYNKWGEFFSLMCALIVFYGSIKYFLTRKHECDDR